jgi:acetyl esterase/lipase
MQPVLHRYGQHRSQVAALMTPVGKGPFPVAVLIHGGCFRQRYDRTLMEGICPDLVGRGWATWNLEYRRLGMHTGGGWPATFDDAAAGIDALAGVDAPLDLTRVAAVGHSAGGCLALWAAGRNDAGVAVTDAVGQAPLADLADAAENGVCGDQVPKLLGGGPDRQPERYAASSPIERLPLRCRTLIVWGDCDDVVPAGQCLPYAERAGAGCALSVVAGEDHYAHLDPRSASWRAVAEWL